MVVLTLFFSALLCFAKSVQIQGPSQQTLVFWDDPAAHVHGQTPPFGLSTFANLPFQNCFTSSNSKEDAYDIAVLGAPFDLGVTGRPGARSGPRGIRSGSERLGGHNFFTGRKVLDSWAKIVDCGDADLTVLDKQIALKQLYHTHNVVVSSRGAYSAEISSVPRILTLGGDHTTSLPALRSTSKHWGPVSVIHFDSHIDTWDSKLIGGGVSLNAGVNHGTWLHVAHSEGLISNNSMHVGIHAPTMNPKRDIENDRRCGFEIITSRDLDTKGTERIVQDIKSRIGEGYVYISVDIDVLDPAYAPGTGTPEPGGLSTRELLTILDGLTGLNVIGADIVEVTPAYDTNGEITILAAAHVALSLLSLMVEKQVKL